MLVLQTSHALCRIIASSFCLTFALLAIRVSAAYQSFVIGEVTQRDTDRPIYEVNFPSLGEDPPPRASSPEPLPLGFTALNMVTARGQSMRCLLPPPPSANVARASPAADEARFDDIDDLLAEYENKCYVRIESWWTYEFCYGKHVIQKHVIPKDRDPHVGEVEDSFVLGRFSREFDLVRRKNSSEVSTNDAAFTQMFGNGTICDTTGKPRRVLVKYMCRNDVVQLSGSAKKAANSNINLLKAVREIESCVYEIEFMNGAICQHAAYKEKLARVARPIHCSMEDGEGPFEGLTASKYRKSTITL